MLIIYYPCFLHYMSSTILTAAPKCTTHTESLFHFFTSKFVFIHKYNLGLKLKDVNFLTFFGTNSNQFLNFISFKTTSQLKDVFALWDKTLQRFDSNLENEILNKDLVWAFYSFVLNI